MTPLIVKKIPDLDLSSLVISSERLNLYSLNHQFAQDIFAEFNEDITRYMVPRPPIDILDTESFIDDSIEGMKLSNEVVLAIVKSDNNEFLGCCGLHGRDSLELGIWLKKAAHGNKFGLEAMQCLAAWSLEYIEFDYLVYPVDKANIASRKIPQALGGEVFNRVQKTSQSGIVLNEVIYKISHTNLISCLA